MVIFNQCEIMVFFFFFDQTPPAASHIIQNKKQSPYTEWLCLIQSDFLFFLDFITRCSSSATSQLHLTPGTIDNLMFFGHSRRPASSCLRALHLIRSSQTALPPTIRTPCSLTSSELCRVSSGLITQWVFPCKSAYFPTSLTLFHFTFLPQQLWS